MLRFARALWRCRAPLSVLCALGLYVLGLPFGWMYAATARQRVSAAAVPPAVVGMVFGAAAPQGRPSPMLAGRLELGARLYRAGKVQVLLVTGDSRRSHHNEPLVMRDYLLAAGVPRDRIVLDGAGYHTWESCVRAKKVFGVDRAILITQRFHLPRALTLCRAAGIRAWGVGDDSRPYAPNSTLFSYLRELPAGLKAIVDLVMRPGQGGGTVEWSPAYRGEKLPSRSTLTTPASTA